MLHKGEDNPQNWYDTGASILEDVLEHRPRLKGLHVDIRPMVVHLGGASYGGNATLKQQAEWLKQNEAIWSKAEK
jgi:DNA-directed RNA polymerase alpha subunit